MMKDFHLFLNIIFHFSVYSTSIREAFKKKPKKFWQMSKLLWPPPPPLILTKNHFHFYAWKTLFDKFQKYVILPPTPTHLTPLESCQKVSKNVTNVTGDMISGKYAQTYTPIPPHTPKK